MFSVIVNYVFFYQPLEEQTTDKVTKLKDTFMKGAGGIFNRGSNVSKYFVELIK